MDNNTIAVLSIIMISLGFIQGCSITKILNEDRVKKIDNMLSIAIEKKFEADKKIDELEKQLEEEQHAKQELVNQLSCLVNRHSYLPPPERPLKRSRYCSEDSCDQTFVPPSSPTCD